MVFGQYSPLDDPRQPLGAETAWAYTHVPQVTRGDAAGELTGSWDTTELNAFTTRIEAQGERFAPGFKRLVLARNILGPHKLEHANRNLVNAPSTVAPRAITNSLVSDRLLDSADRKRQSTACC